MEKTCSVELPTVLTQAAGATPPQVALVLGSGLGTLARRVNVQVAIPFADIPGLEAPSVEYHRGMLTLGNWGGQRVLVFEGRLHYYEGHPWQKVELLPALAAQLGARTLVLTNAA